MIENGERVDAAKRDQSITEPARRTSKRTSPEWPRVDGHPLRRATRRQETLRRFSATQSPPVLRQSEPTCSATTRGNELPAFRSCCIIFPLRLVFPAPKTLLVERTNSTWEKFNSLSALALSHDLLRLAHLSPRSLASQQQYCCARLAISSALFPLFSLLTSILAQLQQK